MSILVLTSDTLIGTAATGNLEYNGQFFGTDSAGSRAQLQRFVQPTVINTTSGTTALFSSIPSWAKKITVGLSSVTYASTSLITIQVGTSGGLVSSGYTGQVYTQNTSASTFTTAFLLQAANTSAAANSGIATLFEVDPTNNIWVFASTLGSVGSTAASMGGGRVALASALTQLQISTVAGTTFSAGAVNIIYEG